MEEMKRPGGLTALAVINFVFAALALLSAAGTILSKMLLSNVPMDQLSEKQAAQIAVVMNMSGTIMAVIVFISIICFLLLLLSGIGYLKQKQIMGRYIGSVYGVVAIVYTILTTIVYPDIFGQSLGIGTIINLIYPVLTLILLNTIFKKNLVQ